MEPNPFRESLVTEDAFYNKLHDTMGIKPAK
jgi:hypothetical protein